MITVAPTTQDDVEAFLQTRPWRLKAVTGRVNGEIKGIGGIAFLPDGLAVAFLEASEDDCRRYPITLHRTAKAFLDDARGRGMRNILALVDSKREAADRWLKRLGFERIGESGGEVVYQWRH